MVFNINDQMVVVMGFGDVGLDSGYMKTSKGSVVGTLGIATNKKREVGTVIDISGEHHEISEYPVVLTFSKIRSVDTMINALQDIKRGMEGN